MVSSTNLNCCKWALKSKDQKNGRSTAQSCKKKVQDIKNKLNLFQDLIAIFVKLYRKKVVQIPSWKIIELNCCVWQYLLS